MAINNIDLKDRIINSARLLFKTQGYDQTTIRQLVSKCQITTGTLYKYFDNKQDVFNAVRGDDLNRVKQFVQMITKETNEPLLFASIDTHIVFTLAQKYERYAEAIISSHKNHDVNQVHISDLVEFSKLCFAGYIKNYSDHDYRTRALIIKGIYNSIIGDYLTGYDSDLSSKINLVVKSIYKLYNVPEAKIESILLKTSEIMRQYETDLFKILD
ncbi:MAG: TetR family transcriptional regulator [Clostridiales bacterium]|nr:TetR family transcriptional regulator [Clostridiales bacterium]